MGTGIGLYLMVRSLFVLHLTKEFGWTRGDIGVAGMVAFVTGALALPVVGRTDRSVRPLVRSCSPACRRLSLALSDDRAAARGRSAFISC